MSSHARGSKGTLYRVGFDKCLQLGGSWSILGFVVKKVIWENLKSVGSRSDSGSVAGMGQQAGIDLAGVSWNSPMIEEKGLNKHLSGIREQKRPDTPDGVKEKPTRPSQVSNVRGV